MERAGAAAACESGGSVRERRHTELEIDLAAHGGISGGFAFSKFAKANKNLMTDLAVVGIDQMRGPPSIEGFGNAAEDESLPECGVGGIAWSMWPVSRTSCGGGGGPTMGGGGGGGGGGAGGGGGGAPHE